MSKNTNNSQNTSDPVTENKTALWESYLTDPDEHRSEFLLEAISPLRVQSRDSGKIEDSQVEFFDPLLSLLSTSSNSTSSPEKLRPENLASIHHNSGLSPSLSMMNIVGNPVDNDIAALSTNTTGSFSLSYLDPMSDWENSSNPSQDSNETYKYADYLPNSKQKQSKPKKNHETLFKSSLSTTKSITKARTKKAKISSHTTYSDYEQRVLKGVELMRNHNVSIRAAAKRFNVSHETLRRRFQGSSSRKDFHTQLMALNPEEEIALEKMIFTFVTYGSMITSTFLCNLANDFRKEKALKQGLMAPKNLGVSWTAGFRRRHKDVCDIMAKSMNRERIGKVNQHAISYDTDLAYSEWFDQLSKALHTHSINPANIYSLAEYGISIKANERNEIDYNFSIGQQKGLNQRHMNQKPAEFLLDEQDEGHNIICVSRSESFKSSKPALVWASALECISTKNLFLTPHFTVKKNRLLSKQNVGYQSSESGWTDSDSMYYWLSQVFEPNTNPQIQHSNSCGNGNNQEYRLIILEGISDIFSSKVLSFAVEHKILFAVFPSKSSRPPTVLSPAELSLVSLKQMIEQTFSGSPDLDNQTSHNVFSDTYRKSETIGGIISSLTHYKELFDEINAIRMCTLFPSNPINFWESCGIFTLNGSFDTSKADTGKTAFQKTTIISNTSNHSLSIGSKRSARNEGIGADTEVTSDLRNELQNMFSQSLKPKTSNNISTDQLEFKSQRILTKSYPTHDDEFSIIFKSSTGHLESRKHDFPLNGSINSETKPNFSKSQYLNSFNSEIPFDDSRSSLFPSNYAGNPNIEVGSLESSNDPYAFLVEFETLSNLHQSPVALPTSTKYSAVLPASTNSPTDCENPQSSLYQNDWLSSLDFEIYMKSLRIKLFQHFHSRGPLYYSDGTRADIDDAKKITRLIESLWSQYCKDARKRQYSE